MKNGTAEKPNGVISSPPIVSAPRGSIQPHSLLLRMPNTASPRPSDESSDADDVELRTARRRAASA